MPFLISKKSPNPNFSEQRTQYWNISRVNVIELSIISKHKSLSFRFVSRHIIGSIEIFWVRFFIMSRKSG